MSVSITTTANVSDTGSTYLKNATVVESFKMGSDNYVLAGGNEGGISLFKVNADGTLTSTANITTGANFVPQSISTITTATGHTFAYVAGSGTGSALKVFEVGAGGTLTSKSTFNSTSGTKDLDQVYEMEEVVRFV